MIVILTRRGLDVRLARHRRALAAQFATAIEKTVPPSCDHRDRPSCPKCAARRTVLASAKVVRETGGIL